MIIIHLPDTSILPTILGLYRLPNLAYQKRQRDHFEFYMETQRKVLDLHLYDCFRANKAMSAWGVEPRVPFLDADFLEVAMNINPEEKMIKKATLWEF